MDAAGRHFSHWLILRVKIVTDDAQHVYTVHSESIQSPLLFSHVMLQPYAKTVQIIFSLIRLHSIHHNDEAESEF